MSEVANFCVRVLGEGPAAEQAALHAIRGGGDRIIQLAAAARLCRDRSEPLPEPQPVVEGQPLEVAVAAEMAGANARLPERQREALALRELLRLSHDQIAEVMGLEPTAVAPLLARARVRLRRERRGRDTVPEASCPQQERSLRLLAARQDSEPLSAEEDDWLLEHLRLCRDCTLAHAAMLEASVCYRAWPAPGRGATA